MKKFKSRLKNQGGFTLIEMLIVVAIIAILVAVSIPIVNTSLEKAREATDAANERAAKMAVTVEFLTKGNAAEASYYYDAEAGIAGTTVPATKYGKCAAHKGAFVKVALDKTTGECTITWTTTGSDTVAPTHGIISE